MFRHTPAQDRHGARARPRASANRGSARRPARAVRDRRREKRERLAKRRRCGTAVLPAGRRRTARRTHAAPLRPRPGRVTIGARRPRLGGHGVPSATRDVGGASAREQALTHVAASDFAPSAGESPRQRRRDSSAQPPSGDAAAHAVPASVTDTARRRVFVHHIGARVGAPPTRRLPPELGAAARGPRAAAGIPIRVRRAARCVMMRARSSRSNPEGQQAAV